MIELLEDRLAPALFTINNILDDGSTGSLRWAVAQANSNLNTVTDPTDTITFDAGVFAAPRTITLTQGELRLLDTSGATTIQGPGAGLLTVSGNHASVVFVVDGGVTAALDGLTVANGYSTYGGGIHNAGTLTLSNSTLSGNAATYAGGGILNKATLTVTGSTLSGNTAGEGGGIYNGGTLTLSNTTLSGNAAKGKVGGGIANFGTLTVTGGTLSGNAAYAGGGIYNSGGLTVTGSTLSDNTATFGGGIFNSGALKVTDSTLSRNSATDYGGGIFNSGTATVSASTLAGNTATTGGGGIFTKGALTVTGSTLSGNKAYDGGGIHIHGGPVTISSSTLAGNSAARYGGAISNEKAWLTVTGSTLAGNSANYGGAISNWASLTVSNSTLAGNTANSDFGGGITNEGYAWLGGSIVAGNTASVAGPDVAGSGGTYYSLGHNLIGIIDLASTWYITASDLVGTSAAPIDPRLAPLGDYGGPTQTMALLPGSPALDAGGPTTTLTAAVSEKDTKLGVAWAYAIASTPGRYLIRIDSEEMVVTVSDSATLTVERGANGTAAASHDAGAGVFLLTDQRGQPRFSGNSVDIGAFEVYNQPPTAHAGGPYTVEEGGSLSLDGSKSSDPDGDPLSYSWTINGQAGAAEGVNPTLTWAQLQALGIGDGPAPFSVSVRVSDGQGHSVESAAVSLTLTNAAPAAALTGPTSGVRGQTLTFTLAATDPSPADQDVEFTYAIDWDGDGITDETVRGPDGTGVNHVFEKNGKYTVLVTATDKDGGTSAVTSHTVDITSAAAQADKVVVGGSTGNDKIEVSKGSIVVTFLDPATGAVLEQYSFDEPSGGVIVYGQDGDDEIRVDAAITIPVQLYGGGGNDILVGGSGNDLLDGGAGDDLLDGGAGDDAFNGGGGSNEIIPGTGNDALGLGYGLALSAPGSLSGDSDAVRGQAITFAVSGTLPAGVQVTWAFGDGQTAGNSLAAAHAYVEAGTYSARLAVTDASGARTTITRPLRIAVVAIQDDLPNPGKTVLAVGGTEGNDAIILAQGASAGELVAELNGATLGTYTPTGRLLVFGQAGNDDIQVSGSVTYSAWLYGGAGDDRIKGGAGHDVLIGGDGADLLVGGSGRDFLIGGKGADRIVGNGGDDILIAGSTRYDAYTQANATALCAIMKEWTSTRDFATRLANLSGTGTGPRDNGNYFLTASGTERTVLDDGADADVLTGSSAEEYDWFFYNSTTDRATDLNDDVFAMDLAFIQD